jgi:hypothetical protein
LRRQPAWKYGGSGGGEGAELEELTTGIIHWVTGFTMILR